MTRAKGSPSTITTDENTDRPPAGGLVVLAELYANGQGVAQNDALAARFFCEAIDTGEIPVGQDAADPEQNKDALAMLNRIEARKAADALLVFCDGDGNAAEDTPYTLNCEARAEEVHAEMHAGGIQSGIDAAQQDADDADKAIKPVVAKFAPTQRAAYERLAKAMQHLIDTQVTGDALFVGGYGSGGLYPNEEHAAFENSVAAASAKPPVTPTPQEMTAADAALNQAYQKSFALEMLPEVCGRWSR